MKRYCKNNKMFVTDVKMKIAIKPQANIDGKGGMVIDCYVLQDGKEYQPEQCNIVSLSQAESKEVSHRQTRKKTKHFTRRFL